MVQGGPHPNQALKCIVGALCQSHGSALAVPTWQEDKREWFKDSSKEEDTRRLVLEAWNNVSSLNESTSPLPSHDSSSFDDLWESSEVRPKLKRKKPPPGLVYTRDINPNYRPGSFDKFMVLPAIVLRSVCLSIS